MRGNDKVRMKIIFRRRSVRTDDDSGERGDATLLERVFHLESINKSLGELVLLLLRDCGHMCRESMSTHVRVATHQESEAFQEWPSMQIVGIVVCSGRALSLAR